MAIGGLVFLGAISGFIPCPGEYIFSPAAVWACSSFERDAGEWNQLGVDHLRRGELAAALKSFRKVLFYGKRRGDRVLISIAIGNIGVVYRARGDLTRARALLEEAVALDEATGALRRMAISYGNLGVVYIEENELGRAEEMFRKALAIHRVRNDRPHMARCFGKLGIIYQASSDFDRASTMYRKALMLEGEIGGEVWREQHRARLREVNWLRRHSLEAEERSRGGDRSERGAGAWRENGAALSDKYHDLAVSLRTEGKLKKAAAAHLKAVAIDRKLGRKASLARDYSGLGIVYKTQGELRKAVAMHKKALVFAEEVGDKAPLAAVYANLGAVYHHRGDKARACEHWGKARTLFEEIAARTDLDRTLDLMKSAQCP
jgi:tetratricopeptide (TPR) repeat protein